MTIRLRRMGVGVYESHDSRFHIYPDEGRWYLTDYAWDIHPCETFRTLGEARDYITEVLARPNHGKPGKPLIGVI